MPTWNASFQLRCGLSNVLMEVEHPIEAQQWLEAFNIMDVYLPDVNREYKQYTSPEGRYYYYHIASGQVSWQAPPGYVSRRQLANVLSHYFVLYPQNVPMKSTTKLIPFTTPPPPTEAPPVSHKINSLINFSARTIDAC